VSTSQPVLGQTVVILPGCNTMSWHLITILRPPCMLPFHVLLKEPYAHLMCFPTCHSSLAMRALYVLTPRLPDSLLLLLPRDFGKQGR
jgi:hypothetical protein